MIPEPEVCERARHARDPRFDGRFFIAVLTTGIYCRPICPARTPAQENIRYYPSAAAAQDAGYRPCMRCRPERAASLPIWTVASDTVIRGLDLINSGYLNNGTVSELAGALGVGARQLNRLFQEELAASPKSIARMQRVQLARQLIDETDMPFGEVALAAGYRSLRRFNDEISTVFGRPPRILRRMPRVVRADADVVLRLPLRTPYDRSWVLGFLGRRALTGLERVEGQRYFRRLAGPEADVELSVELGPDAARVTIPASAAHATGRHLARIRQLFDLGADSMAIDSHLENDPHLMPAFAAGGGIRVPGAWDAYELAVRAILGQQVSVARATDLGNRLVAMFGSAGEFPAPADLVDVNPAELGMPGRRGDAIRLLARAVTEGTVELEPGIEVGRLREQLCVIPGVGPWTAEYIAMRAGRDPDAFPNSDWVVCKYLDATPAQARATAEPWRPWRSYALMYLWSASNRAAAA